MKSPPDSAIANDAEDSPAFERLEDPETLLEGDRTRDDFLSVALQLREPTAIAAIADRAGRGTDAAREYMRWFEMMGLVRKASDDPERYVTNRSYLYWRRVDDIRESHSEAEIVSALQSVLDDLEALEARYEALEPEDIAVVPTARERDVSVETVWEDFNQWKTLLARRDLLEDALHRKRNRDRDTVHGHSGESSTRRFA
jgi:hypothetical protein